MTESGAVECATPNASSRKRNSDWHGQSAASFTGPEYPPTSDTSILEQFSRLSGRKMRPKKRNELLHARADDSTVRFVWRPITLQPTFFPPIVMGSHVRSGRSNTIGKLIRSECARKVRGPRTDNAVSLISALYSQLEKWKSPHCSYRMRPFVMPTSYTPMSEKRDMGHPFICGWSDVGHRPVH